MKNLIEKMKASILAIAAWFAQWPKDLILHFHLADNINTVAWIASTALLGCFSAQEWAISLAMSITLIMIISKEQFDDRADWKDILAGIIGMIWSFSKIWLITMLWRAFFM